jgi:hypothetical protein
MRTRVARTCSPRSAVLQVAPTKSRGPKEQVRATLLKGVRMEYFIDLFSPETYQAFADSSRSI